MSAELFLLGPRAAAGVTMVTVVVVMVTLLLRLRVRRHHHLRLVPNFLRGPETRPISGPARARRVASGTASVDAMQGSGFRGFPEERTKTGRWIKPVLLFDQALVVAAAAAAVTAAANQSVRVRLLPAFAVTLVHCLPCSQVVLERNKKK